MKTYFRLLSFAKPIEKFAIPYVLAIVLAIGFNTLNLTLLAPLLETLFLKKPGTSVSAADAAEGSSFNIMEMFSSYVDYYVNHYGAWKTLVFVCITIIVTRFLFNLFYYLSQRIMENLRAHTLYNLRNKVFNNVMDLHVGFFNNERKGDIISKVSSDVQVVQYSVTSTLQVLFREPLQIIAYLFVLFSVSAKLTFYSLLIVPVAGLLIGRIAKRLKKQAASAQQSFGLMISYLDEALSGIKVIKAFNATGTIKSKYQDENRRYTRTIKRMAARQQLASPISEFLSVTMVALIVLYGGNLILNGDDSEFSASSFIVYIAVFSQVVRPVKALTDAFTNIHAGIAAGERVLELIDTKPAIKESENPSKLSGFEKEIRFDKVFFAYGDRVVLDEVSLVIPKGKTIALVGPSGGGKSTLMDLIPRFIEPQNGTITFDDVDIRNLSTQFLRSQMGIVTQESILFNDTIFNNIAFGKPDASEQEVEEAARIANAHQFISETEFGYQTNIGDRGMKLSGGQKQRIAIARAVLQNPPIMLLDEATSALDTESEKLVQDALYKLMQQRTSLVIAHRLSTIQNADQIIVLESGRIAEQGTHQELVKHNGLYKRLIEMQQFVE